VTTSWLLPNTDTVPSPLRVSTFAEPENGDVKFEIGKYKSSTATWPIHCARIRICIPIGRRAGQLTGEPSLIKISHTPSSGKQWEIETNYTDPMQAVIDFIPPVETHGQYAVFDGTYTLNVTLSEIEINGAQGKVDLVVEERTKAPSETSFTTREITRQVEKKEDTAETFSFHSLRPAEPVIDRDTTVQLNWEGSKNATTYSVTYYDRNGDKQTKPASASGWTSASTDTFLDATTFIVKATLAGHDYYQTTHVKVKDPITSVYQLAVTDKVTSNLTVDTSRTLTIRTLSGGGSPITVSNNLTQSGHDAGITTGTRGLTANGDVVIATGKTLTANGDVSVNSSKTLTIRNLSGGGSPITVSNNLTQSGTAAGITTGTGGLTVNGNASVTGELTIAGLLKVNGQLQFAGAPQELRSGASRRSFTAPTTGLVIMQFGAGGNGPRGALAVKDGSSTVFLTNGFSGPGAGLVSGSMTLTAIVPKGMRCEMSTHGPDVEFWVIWIPFGTGQISLS
jgi:hypothetical protein